MSESKALLSQDEIDALVSFLKESKDIPDGAVLDQKSIDKLIGLIQLNGAYTLPHTPEGTSMPELVIIDENTKQKLDLANCELCVDFADNGYINVYIKSDGSDTRYFIGPDTIKNFEYNPNATAAWGYALAPSLFMQAAHLFKVQYSNATLETVKKQYAKIMYGNENAEIPSYFLP